MSTPPLWTSAQAIEATWGLTTRPWVATGVSIDTRSLQPGDLFVALKDLRDGHEFVADALAKGAAAALVSHVPEGLDHTAPLLVVDDVLIGLQHMAQYARARMHGKVIAITGSVGKTSTKEMLRSALDGQGRVHAAEASYNNHWGVPLTLARMPADTDFAVIEIGMSAPGEIAPLARLARPDVGLITTIGLAHLEAFEGLDGIAREKIAIFDGMDLETGMGVVPDDLDDVARQVVDLEMPVALPRIWFGTESDNPAHLVRVTTGEQGSVVEAVVDAVPVVYRIAAPGQHLVLNGLGALTAAIAAGADPALTAQGLGRWAPPAGRGQREVLMLDPADKSKTIELIDDAFNANPTSVAAALDVFASAPATRRVAFLGDMLELGEDERALHAALATHPAMKGIDLLYCAGPRMRALFDVLPAHRQGGWAETADELASQVAQLLCPGDAVLVKGSKGAKTSRIVDAIRNLGHRERQ